MPVSQETIDEIERDIESKWRLSAIKDGMTALFDFYAKPSWDRSEFTLQYLKTLRKCLDHIIDEIER